MYNCNDQSCLNNYISLTYLQSCSLRYVSWLFLSFKPSFMWCYLHKFLVAQVEERSPVCEKSFQPAYADPNRMISSPLYFLLSFTFAIRHFFMFNMWQPICLILGVSNFYLVYTKGIKNTFTKIKIPFKQFRNEKRRVLENKLSDHQVV